MMNYEKLKSPGYYETEAQAAQQAGNWALAAALWDKARAASIGHTRRDRYEARAAACRAKQTGASNHV